MEVNLGESPMGDELPNIAPGYGFRIKKRDCHEEEEKIKWV